MAITRKPQKMDSREVEVEALIQKGGSIAGDVAMDVVTGKATSVILRLSPDIIHLIDQSVRSRRIKIPRHTWLLEAVIEKLDREMESRA